MHDRTNNESARKAIVAVGGGVTLGWAALAASYRLNPAFSVETFRGNFDPKIPETVYATGGFPLKAYAYPIPPMGPGPSQSPLPLAVDFLFWIVVCYGLLLLSGKKKPSDVLVGALLVLAAVSTVFGVAYLALKFD